MTELEEAVEGTRKRKGKGLSLGKAFMLFLFIVGFIAGIYLQHYFVEPQFNKEIKGDVAECEAKLSLQDKQIDSCLACLQENGVNPNEC